MDARCRNYTCLHAEFQGLLSVYMYAIREGKGEGLSILCGDLGDEGARGGDKVFIHGPARFLQPVGFMKNRKVMHERKFERVVGTPCLLFRAIT